ncbi:hypothetical protein FQA39_LY15510 [Lamprigera yunnana]|nr:hypothetical protein FQA39_LY15510 [Lamprigera yunnana]
MFSIKSIITRTDVTSVRFTDDYILSGIGGKLYIFNKDLQLVRSCEVFRGAQIFGILPNISKTKYLIYGENHLKVIDDNFEEILCFACDDWIICAKWINCDDNIVTISMHNKILLWTSDLKLIEALQCEESCILYSAHIVNNTWDDLIILSGTVFNQILIWRPHKYSSLCPVLTRLVGHKGVIFSIDCNQSIGIICSTSDDRSARLWSIKHNHLSVELAQKIIDITLKYTLFCHSARVFRCLLLNNYVLTAGEDSLLIIWDLDGKVVQKFELHKSASIWAIDYNSSNNKVVTGGGDCGVILFPLFQNITRRELKMMIPAIIKKVAILNNGNFVCISENGLLLLYSDQKKEWSEIDQLQDLNNYSLLEVSLCRSIIALAGYCGSIHLYEVSLDELKYVSSHRIPNEPRIYSLHWLSSDQFLTCESEGILKVWVIQDRIILNHQFILPDSKERWTTTACLCDPDHIAVGDRKGNIYIFKLDYSQPVQVIKHAHNYLGITNLYFKNNLLTSLGRNSIIKTHQFQNFQFSLLSSDKLPFSWLTSICEDDKNTLILAFLGNEFVMWDYKKRRTLLQFECGGGHRSWDFYRNLNIKFAYIKENKINLIQCDPKVLQATDLIEGFHSNNINACFCILSKHAQNKSIILSGGEDTTLRLSTIYYVKGEHVIQNVYKSHLSSIRTITACKINCESDVEKYMVVSGGGREQIILWELEVDAYGIACSEKYFYYKKSTSEQSETRIMDVCTICVNDTVVIIAGASNGTLKVFLTTKENDKYNMTHLGNIFYKLRCILKVNYLKMCNQHFVLSTSTDGIIAFWNFTDVITHLEESRNSNLLEVVKSVPLIQSIKVHVSGINSLYFKVINEGQCLLLTGGDDCSVVLILLAFCYKDSEISINVLSKFSDTNSHCAQVTGVFLVNNYFISTSVDQKLNISTWTINDGALIGKYQQSYHSNVAHIQGVDFWENGILYILVYGKGIEIYQVNENKVD